jgi:flagellar biosynthetic protein FlhB
MADKGQRTEQPTQRRKEKARKEGRFPASREFVAAVAFLAFVWLFAALGSGAVDRMRQLVATMLRRAFTVEVSIHEVERLGRYAALIVMAPLMAAGLALSASSVGAQLATTRLGLAWNRVKPEFNRLNPIERLRQLPSQTMPLFLQAVAILPLLAWAVWAVLKQNLPAYLALPLGPVEGGAALVAETIRSLLWKAAGILLLLGVFDLTRQRRRHMSELRMSKQEIRDEMKEVEGNPQIKMKIRRLQRDMIRKQMMREVPAATAVIVNPTHYAVAVKYRPAEMAAPRVVAKGKNYLALRIRAIAIENQVPIVENPPLAQALYKSVEVGEEIPLHLYQAVAEVLAYIYRLMKGRMPGFGQS